MLIDLRLKLDDNKEAASRVKEAAKKRAAAKYEPTLDEVWRTGYTSHTGTFKKPILDEKTINSSDKEKLIAVKQAIECGELGTGVETLTKFSKAHALRLYKQLQELRREQLIADMVENMPKNYHLVDKM